MFAFDSEAKNRILRELSDPEKKDNPFFLENGQMYLRFTEFRLEFTPHEEKPKQWYRRKIVVGKDVTTTVTVRFYYASKEVFSYQLLWNGKDPIHMAGIEGRNAIKMF